MFAGEVAGGLDVGDEVGREHVEAQGGESEDEEDLKHAHRVLAEGVADRAELLGAFGRGLLEQIGLVGARADPETDGRERQSQEEGNAPAPGVEGRVAHHSREQQDEAAGEDRGQCGGGEGDVDPQSALAHRCVFVDEGGSADRFAAGGEALAQSGEDEQDGREPADLVEAGQDADESGADADEEDRDRQRLAPADLVTEGTEEQPAQGAHDEGDAEGGEDDEQSGDFVAVGEEVFGEDDGREAVEREVVELDELADAAAVEHLLLHTR